MKQRQQRVLLLAVVLLGVGLTSVRVRNLGTAFLGLGTRKIDGLVVEPYLQLGPAPVPNSGDLCVLWQTEDTDIPWSVEYRPVTEPTWRMAAPVERRQVVVPSVTTHWVNRAALRDLKPGVEFLYRLRKNDQIVFESHGQARRGPGQTHRFVAFGDCAANTFDQTMIAFQAYKANPDFIMITGDIVYNRGRISEYRDRFWPVYNADSPAPSWGAPLLRSRLFVAAAGNHDVGSHDLTTFADSLAYFLYWDQPLNGPLGPEGSALTPQLGGQDAAKAAFRNAAGDAYPRMSNFSFDYGDVHWTVLDSNYYADWTHPDARTWLEHDLAAASAATWRFVAFHHPGFNSSRAHYGDQRMRLIAPILEAGHVDIVFNGHVHNYQRTYPLRFRPAPRPTATPPRQDVPIPGEWNLDTRFDGETHAKPDGIIYLVTGGGGATLYNPEQDDDPASWQPFTRKLVSRVHSFTIVDVDGPELRVRQVGATGETLDQFRLTR